MKNLILLLLIAFNCNTMVADSFLTSTQFSKAYQNKRIVKLAKTSNQINDRLIKFILKKRNPVAIKLAIINQLGWEFKGEKSNSDLFLEYVIQHGLFNDFEDMIENADEEILICVAYMKAMDDYSDVNEALTIAWKAKFKDDRGSYALNLICALIEAQKEFLKGRWCRSYKICDTVRSNKKLKKDIKDDAVKILFDYVEHYKEYCNK